MTSSPAPSRPSATGSVVVGVDGSETSVRAAVHAAGVARRRGRPLLVVHVSPYATGNDALPLTSSEVAAQFLRSATRLAEAAAATVREETGYADVTGAVVDDHPVDGLVALSAEAELVVVGATGASGLPGLLLGSTAGAVVQHAGCPVIALPGGADPVGQERGPVVAAVDGGPGQDEVLTFAAAEAVTRGVRLDVVHAWRDVAVEVALGPYGGLVDWAEVEAVTRRELGALVAGLRERTPGLDARDVVVRAPTVPALRDAGDGASLLVLGHRPRRFARLSSTTHGVLHRATCPVAVVPLRGPADVG